MKKKTSVLLAVLLSLLLGCFSTTFAASKPSEKSNVNSTLHKKKEVKAKMLNDEDTKLLLHMDESTFKDEYGHNVTNNGVTLDTTDKKDGSGSAYFNGSGSLSVAGTSDDFNMNDFDCMIDFWIKFKTPATSQGEPICTSSNYSYAAKTGWGINVSEGGWINYIFYISGNQYFYHMRTATLFNEEWHNIRIIKNGAKIGMLYDGKVESFNDYQPYTGTSTGINIGMYEKPDSNLLKNAYIDEFSFRKGTYPITDGTGGPTITGNRATLIINMVNGTTKEYDLSAEEVTDFLNWYDSRSKGTAVAYYTFTVPPTGPYVGKKDYIAYDKIDDFEVKEYNSSGSGN